MTYVPENIYPSDSNAILKDKFLLAGFIAPKNLDLGEVANRLLSLAQESFKTEVDLTFAASDLIIPSKGNEIFKVYNKYFSIDCNEYDSAKSFLENIVDPFGVNVEWVSTQESFLVSEYSFDLIEFDFSDNDFDLLKILSFALLLDEKVSYWSRNYLYYLLPDYFKSGRRSTFYKNKNTRKLLAYKKFLDYLPEEDFIAFLKEYRDDFIQKRESPSPFYLYETTYALGIRIINEYLENNTITPPLTR